MRIALSFALAMLAVCVARAGEFKPLAGQYVITGPSLMDAPADEERDRVVLFLEGDAAREVYRGMTAPAKSQVCAPEGALTKVAGGVECTFEAKDDSYRCWIGVGLGNGQAVHTDIPC